MHACLIAFPQIENTADHIDARTAFAIFNTLCVESNTIQAIVSLKVKGSYTAFQGFTHEERLLPIWTQYCLDLDVIEGSLAISQTLCKIGAKDSKVAATSEDCPGVSLDA